MCYLCFPLTGDGDCFVAPLLTCRDGDSDSALLRNSPEFQQAAAGTLFKPFTSFAHSSKLGLALIVKVLRRDGDSNPGNPFGVYTLSRRASSTTRASLHCAPVRSKSISATKVLHFSQIRKSLRKIFANFRYFMRKRAFALRLVVSITCSTEQL